MWRLWDSVSPFGKWNKLDYYFSTSFLFKLKKCLSQTLCSTEILACNPNHIVQSRSPFVGREEPPADLRFLTHEGACGPYTFWAHVFGNHRTKSAFLKLDCAYKSQGILLKCTCWFIWSGGRLELCISNRALILLLLLAHTTHTLGIARVVIVQGLFKEEHLKSEWEKRYWTLTFLCLPWAFMGTEHSLYSWINLSLFSFDKLCSRKRIFFFSITLNSKYSLFLFCVDYYFSFSKLHAWVTRFGKIENTS